MIPVIMAGGSGTRLWPLSRKAYPKQFLKLGEEETMLQQAVNRLQGISNKKPIIITNENHRFLVAEQLRQINQEAEIILEPEGKNTAPAIALAALEAVKHEPQALLLVLSADQIIKNVEAFHVAVNDLMPSVEQGKFGTIGIVPSEPATGYGYIKSSKSSNKTMDVEEFVEKPDLKTAQAYLDSGNYYWNSGIFLVRADRYLEELNNFKPEMYKACELAMQSTSKDLDFIRVDKDEFAKCPEDSIDYAIMEPLSVQEGEAQVVVAPMDAGWSDVGSWSSLWGVSEKNADGNVVIGDAQTIFENTQDCLVSTEERLVATLGLKDVVIVDTKDALLVAHKDAVQDVKKIVKEVKSRKLGHDVFHREVYRPWGKYDSVDSGERYQVKRITVKPGAKLSVQMHHHRAEHWIVVSGTANVTIDGETFMVSENQSTYIPIGAVHALENPGKLPLEMIEVQSGSYLGEDDIVRFEDRYGRV